MALFEEKEMLPVWQPKASLEDPQKRPEGREIWNLFTHGPLSHTLTLGKQVTCFSICEMGVIMQDCWDKPADNFQKAL